MKYKKTIKLIMKKKNVNKNKAKVALSLFLLRKSIKKLLNNKCEDN